jgi:hypothetical protein
MDKEVYLESLTNLIKIGRDLFIDDDNDEERHLWKVLEGAETKSVTPMVF